MSVGIQRLQVYVPQHAIAFADLAAARRLDVDRLARETGTIEIAIAPPWEDAVTLAATAASRLLRTADVPIDDLGLLAVGTGAGWPAGAPLGLALHQLLGLRPRCGVLEPRPGPLAGAAALLGAADWVRASPVWMRRALVVTTDVVRTAPRAPGELGQGAAAVAMLVGLEPRILLLDEQHGTHTAPGSTDGAREALVGAFTAFRAQERPEPSGEEVVTDRLAHVVHQAASPARMVAAERTLLALDWRTSPARWATVAACVDAALDAACAVRLGSTAEGIARVGDAGAASLGLALSTLVEHEGRVLGGRRIGLTATGEGACGEFFSGLVSARVGVVSACGVEAALAARTRIDVAEYERLAGLPLGTSPPADFSGDFVLRSARGDGRERAYERVAGS